MNYKSYLRQKGYTTKTIKGNLYSIAQLEKWLKNEGIAIETCTYNDLMSLCAKSKRQGEAEDHRAVSNENQSLL